MKRKDIMILLIPSLLIVIFWVVFSVYHNYVNSTIPVSVNMQILSITPDFDLKTIENLKKRNAIEPIYQVTPQGIKTDASPTPTFEPAPLSSSSGNQASQGGELNQ